MTVSVVLASASPRRTALLKQMGITHSILPVDIDESVKGNETPRAQVERLAREKAEAAKIRLESEKRLSSDTVILASDTLISFKNKSVGKPKDKDDAHRILGMLSGNQHEVLTSICVLSNDHKVSEVITTQVSFAIITAQQIDAYWDTGEPADKAGSYAIQGIGGEFVKAINGSASAVVGLPLYETRQLLSKFGVVQ
jgi:septum formation protein